MDLGSFLDSDDTEKVPPLQFGSSLRKWVKVRTDAADDGFKFIKVFFISIRFQFQLNFYDWRG